MISLEDELKGVKRVGFDTVALIYFVERAPLRIDKMRYVMSRVRDGELNGYCSTVALTEVLVVPLRRNDKLVAQEYRNLLLNSRNSRTLDVSPAIAERAADLRARYNLRTPDALHIATAIEADCEAFLTNDGALKRVGEIRVLPLDELQLDAN